MAKTNTKPRKKKIDVDRLDMLATTIRDASGSHMPTFVEEFKAVEKSLRVIQTQRGTTVNMAGIQGSTPLLGNAGIWVAFENWSNAARREISKHT